MCQESSAFATRGTRGHRHCRSGKSRGLGWDPVPQKTFLSRGPSAAGILSRKCFLNNGLRRNCHRRKPCPNPVPRVFFRTTEGPLATRKRHPATAYRPLPPALSAQKTTPMRPARLRILSQRLALAPARSARHARRRAATRGASIQDQTLVERLGHVLSYSYPMTPLPHPPSCAPRAPRAQHDQKIPRDTLKNATFSADFSQKPVARRELFSRNTRET